MTDYREIYDDDMIAGMQAHADAEHARQPTCEHCGRHGEPYTHNGVRFDGLHAHRGERLCSKCLNTAADAEGVDILCVDDRPGREPHVYNTVRDADLVEIWMPPELRGVDGRDLFKKQRNASHALSTGNPTKDRIARENAERASAERLAASLRKG